MKQVSLLAPIQHVSFIDDTNVQELGASRHTIHSIEDSMDDIPNELNSDLNPSAFSGMNNGTMHNFTFQTQNQGQSSNFEHVVQSNLMYSLGNCLFIQNGNEFQKIQVDSEYCTSIKGAIVEKCLATNDTALKIWIFGGKYLGILHVTKFQHKNEPSMDQKKVGLEHEAAHSDEKEGGKCSSYEFHLQDIYRGDARDWIMELKIIGKNLVIGYPHNCIEIFNVQHIHPYTTNIIPRRFVVGPRKSLLYAMSIVSRPKVYHLSEAVNNEMTDANEYQQDHFDPLKEEILIASGTIFGQICIWNSHGEELAFLKGHEGSIFSINWNKTCDALSTTSDDRTVRYWKLKWIQNEDRRSVIELEDVKTFFGHASRVWYSIFFKQYIISAGEDATIRFWDLVSSQCVHILKGHAVKSIWKLAISPDAQWLVSSGGDSSVKTWPIDDILSTIQKHYASECTIPKKFPKDMIRGIQHQTGSSSPVIFTGSASGRIYKLSSTNTIQLIYEPIEHIVDVIRFIISPCNTYGLLATSTGKCIIVNISNGKEVLSFQMLKRLKPSDVYWFTFQGVHHLFCTIFNGSIFHFTSSDSFQSEPQLFREYSLHKASSYLLYIPERNLLIAGTKLGNIDLLHASPYPSEQEVTPNTPFFTLRKLHQKEKVVNLALHDNILFSMSVDGLLWSLRLVQYQNQYVLEKETVQRLFIIIPHIEHFHVSSTNDIIVSGFHSTYFIVYNATQRCRIACIDTGGCRRIHNIYYDDQTGYNISFSIGDKLYIFQQPINNSNVHLTNRLENYSTIHGQFHGRGVYANHALHINDESTCYITGSEDCSVFLSELNVNSNQPSKTRVIHCLDIHESPTRCISTCPRMEPNSYLMVIGGGKEELGIYTLSISPNSKVAPTSQLRQDFENRNPVHPTLHFFESLTEQFLHLFQPELITNDALVKDIMYRIMSIAVFRVNGCNDEQYVIAIGGSDAKVKLFLWNMSTLIPIAMCSTHRGVVKKMKSLQTNDGRMVLVTTATDSKILFFDITSIVIQTLKDVKEGRYASYLENYWNPNPERKRVKLDIMDMKPLQVYEHHHQSGINALHIHMDTALEKIYILTGGDDESLVLFQVLLDSGDIISKITLKEAHASCITGVYTDGDFVISTSTDQRVVAYEIVGNELQLRCSMVSSVADIMDMHVLKLHSHSNCHMSTSPKYRISVVGYGMEIIDL